MVLLRRELGDVLREQRQHQGRTLREVSASASVSLGYLSEVERGEKEASSELLASICRALDLPLSQMLSHVADRVSISEVADQQVTTMLNEGLAKPIRHDSLNRRRVVGSAA
jgi:transcriptional regulator with XRE-family HTH domain